VSGEAKMRTLAIAALIALLAVPAYAAKRGKKADEQVTTEDKQKKKKAEDKAYKRIPDQPVNKDPWGNVR
jgi:hypothetical protein